MADFSNPFEVADAINSVVGHYFWTRAIIEWLSVGLVIAVVGSSIGVFLTILSRCFDSHEERSDE